MESWTLSLLLFILLLYYVYLVSRNLERHQGGTWDGGRLMLYLALPLLLLVYHYVAFGKSSSSLLETISSPLLHWTFFLPVLVAIILMTYAQLTGSSQQVKVGFNIFDGQTLKNLLEGDAKSGLAKRTLLALFNVLTIASAVLVLLFGLTFVVTILRFQRNNLGFFTHLLLYLPCLLSETIAKWVGEGVSALPVDLRAQPPISKTAFVVGVLLLCSLYGFTEMLNTERTYRSIQEKTASLLNLQPDTIEAADRPAQWTVVPRGKDLRLHQPIQISLSSIILEQTKERPQEEMAAVLSNLQQVWSIRFRLFLNTQQQGIFFAGGQSLQSRSRNIFSFGEQDPTTSAAAAAGSNFVELRACEQGVFMLSQFFDSAENNISGDDTFTRKILPVSFQSWHDVVIQHTGGKMDIAVDGQLLESVSTSTSNSVRNALLSPELTFFFLGESKFNGVVSNMRIAFNSAITSTNFDHDSLRDR